jgi:hypothetical protein
MLAPSKVITKLYTVRHQEFANQSGDSCIALLLAITALQLSGLLTRNPPGPIFTNLVVHDIRVTRQGSETRGQVSHHAKLVTVL